MLIISWKNQLGWLLNLKLVFFNISRPTKRNFAVFSLQICYNIKYFPMMGHWENGKNNHWSTEFSDDTMHTNITHKFKPKISENYHFRHVKCFGSFISMIRILEWTQTLHKTLFEKEALQQEIKGIWQEKKSSYHTTGKFSLLSSSISHLPWCFQRFCNLHSGLMVNPIKILLLAFSWNSLKLCHS